MQINLKADGKEQKLAVNLDKRVVALKKMIEDTKKIKTKTVKTTNHKNS